MRTFSYFEHKGRTIHIFKYCGIGPKGRTFYRAALDVEDMPVDWPNDAELQLAIRKLIAESLIHAQ